MSSTERKERASSRNVLLEAALEEFSANGYEETTLAGIAERAGVTTGAIYNHFEGKLDLLVAAVGLPRVGQFWQSVAAVVDLPWHEAAVALSKGLATRPDKAALLLLDVIVLARRDPEVAGSLAALHGRYVAAMQRAAEDGITAGLIEPALAPVDLSRLLAAVSLGLLVLEAMGQQPPSRQAFVQLVDVLLQSHQPDADDDAPALARVRSRSAQAARARDRQREAIVAAAAEGLSLRRIGEAAGLSHERVRGILAEDTDR